MLKAVGKLGFWLAGLTFFVFPVVAYGQDLGSTNGIFRSSLIPNKKGGTTEKKSAPKTAATKKSTPKSTASKSAAKNNPPRKESKPKTESAKNSTVQTQTATNQTGNLSAQNNVGNTVIKPTGKTNDELFDQAIDEGNNARDNRNYVAAEFAYRRAQNLKSKDARAIYGLGNIYSDQQRWEEAEKSYRQAISLEPESPEAYIALSFVLSQPIPGTSLSERYTEAQTMARKAIQLDPKNAIAYDQLGTSLELSGQIGAETQSAYQRAIKLDPNFASAYAHLGRLLRRKGLVKESVAAYNEAVRLATDVPTMILVAEVMQSQQRYAESEKLLTRALAEDPKNPTALSLLGQALVTRGAFDEAEKHLKKSVQISPNSFVSYTLLSSLYARRGVYDQAERVLMQATRVISPNERKRLAAEFEFVGDGFMRVGKARDAARVYRQAISLDNEKNGLTVKLSKAEKS
jgi:tetratricopeptide (TPR) repeat protein